MFFNTKKQNIFKIQNQLPCLNGVFPHVNRSVNPVKFDVKTASVADRRPRQVPSPERSFLGVAVGASRLRAEPSAAVDHPTIRFRNILNNVAGW